MADLKFTISEMQDTLARASKLTDGYSEAISDLDNQIMLLQNDWVSTELGTYEEFVALYRAKGKILFAARDHMIQFCNKLEEKIADFNQAAAEVKSTME